MSEISEKAIKLINDLRRDISIDIMFTPEKNAENNSLKALTDYIAELEEAILERGIEMGKSYRRITKLEADKERLNSCESALISMVQQFFYNKDGEDVFRHAFMSAEEEAANYLVEHGIARWADKRKSSIYFNEVQE